MKTEPKRPTPRHLQDFLRHLDWLREQGADTAVFAEVPDAKVRHFAAEARCLPDNEHVEIVNGEPVLKRLRAKPEPAGAADLERQLKERLAPVDLVDALADTEHWLNWTRHFGPISGFDARIERPQERYLATVFCYDCKLGPS